MVKFHYTITHDLGKLLYTADTLSRSPMANYTNDTLRFEEVEKFIAVMVNSLPASSQCLGIYSSAQDSDPTCCQVKQFCKDGWPAKQQLDSEVQLYWKVRESLTIHDNMLLFNHRIVVPPSLRQATLNKIHMGHQGIERCRMRVRESVWWPGVTSQMAQMVQNCEVCSKEACYRKEPMLKSKLPDYPWQVIGADLFEMKGVHYLMVVDYYSRYPEVAKLMTTTSPMVISKLRDAFARHGIPEVVRSDNGPQFAAQEFIEFAKSYIFCHITSSPRYLQSNG